MTPTLSARAILIGSLLIPTACDSGSDPVGDAGTPRDAHVDRDAATTLDAAADAFVDAGAEDAGIDAGTTESVVIHFRGEVAGLPADCATIYPALGQPPVGARLEDFRFYVHDLALLDADGDATPVTLDDEAPWQRGGVALLDFEDETDGCVNGTPAMRTEVRGRVLPGEYVGLRFVVGVPFRLNHGDRSLAAAPLDASALFWSWRGGYVFSRIDLRTVPEIDAGTPTGFNVHVGSTGCDGSAVSGGTTMCSRPNRPTIVLPTFDPATDVVIVDVAEAVEDVDLTVNTPATALGCMSGESDPECATVLPSFGLDFGAVPAAMDVFRVGAR